MSDTLCNRLADWLLDRSEAGTTTSSTVEKRRSDDLLSAIHRLERLKARIAELETQLAQVETVHERESWREEDGDVLWWAFPIAEPPYCGTPLDDEFPEYVTRWTRLMVPEWFAALADKEST